MSALDDLSLAALIRKLAADSGTQRHPIEADYDEQIAAGKSDVEARHYLITKYAEIAARRRPTRGRR